MRAAAFAILLAAACAGAGATPASQCHGKASKGSLEDGVQLPDSGANFEAYSTVATAMGRNYVHSEVAGILLDAYRALETSAPGVPFVYGETGFAHGGPFRPHRTHQNGLSVDFFVPVRDANGHPARLPTPATQRFGYDIEFDKQGRYGEYRVDFAAMAEHLYQLDQAARVRGRSLALVIVDPAFLPRLLATPRGKALGKLNFMRSKPWVRHDEHYHVDFAIACVK